MKKIGGRQARKAHQRKFVYFNFSAAINFPAYEEKCKLIINTIYIRRSRNV